MEGSYRERVVVWSGLDASRWEIATIKLTEDGVTARGTQIGTAPMVYRLDYELDATQNFVTRLLDVRSEGEGWQRRFVLSRAGGGHWASEVAAKGSVAAP